MDLSQNVSEELEAWREAHKHLTQAVLVAKEAVAAAKIQRRYWMEEICANLTPDGRLSTSSTWKKAPSRATRKAPSKKKLKRKKADETSPEGDGATKKQKTTKTKRIRLNMKNAKGRNSTAQVDSDSQVARVVHHHPLPPGYHPPVAYHTPFSGGKHFVPPPPPPPQGIPHLVDPYAMMHQHVPDHLRPYLAAQSGAPSMPTMVQQTIRTTPNAPNAQPMGAYASVLQGGDSDETSEED